MIKSKKDLKAIKETLRRFRNDTVVECSKCGRRQYLMFANGLKNGWSKCCGYTMSIIFTDADINKAVKQSMSKQIPLHDNANPFIRQRVRKKLDPHINAIIKHLTDGKQPEEVSYVILKLLVKGIGVGVRDGILAQGVMTETLQNYQQLVFMPMEYRILLQRWLDPDGPWQ